MKNAQKFVFKFAIALILLFGIVGCDGFTKTSKDIVVTADDVKEIIISDKQAKTQFDNYSEYRGKIIKIYEDNGRKIGDSLSRNPQYKQGKKEEDKAGMQADEKGFVPVQYTYYKYDDFKKYLKFIEQETKKAGADISTIRIYFANYSADNPDFDKQKRNTVMFVPTIAIDGNESAYYISDEGQDGKPRPYLLSDSFVRANKPAPTSSLDTPKNTNEASLLPNWTNRPTPSLFFAEQSVIGNEGSRNPPR